MPKVFAYSSSKEDSYIAIGYVDSMPMFEVWKERSDIQKDDMAREVAKIVVAVGEIRFDKIGVLNPDHEPATLVESLKFFKGRVRKPVAPFCSFEG